MGREKVNKGPKGLPVSRQRLRVLRERNYVTTRAASQPKGSTLQTHFNKALGPGQEPKKKAVLPLYHPGFLFPRHDSILSEVTLGLEQLWGKARPRLDLVLRKSFKDETFQTQVSFFTDVVDAIKATGMNGGYFFYHHKLKDGFNPMGKTNPGYLSILEPETVMSLFHIYVNARSEFKDRHQDKEQQQLVLRPKGDLPMIGTEDSDGDEDHDMDTGLVIEEHEEEKLFVSDDDSKEEKKMTKKEKQLLNRVDLWMDWLEQERGNAVDPALMKGLKM
ncbi:hypothetical protein F5X99DRAFT_421852 [Biscogniauxia marginata]|nr:hypothetical protein F5X99DRAFT_421852 [Biscogniauxia marginata]